MNTKKHVNRNENDRPGVQSTKNVHQAAKIRAKHIMTIDVVFVPPGKSVRGIAKILSDKHISAVPVVDDDDKIIGIVSEGDLIQREELGTATTILDQGTRGANANYAKSHGKCAKEVMSRRVVTVSEEASLMEIADKMQTEHIKRVPVIQGDRLVGIVSRSNIVQTLAARPKNAGEPTKSDDDIIRFKVIETLMDLPGTSPWLTKVEISNGVVKLSGTVEDENVLEPSREAIRHIAHVVEVEDHRGILQAYWG